MEPKPQDHSASQPRLRLGLSRPTELAHECQENVEGASRRIAHQLTEISRSQFSHSQARKEYLAFRCLENYEGEFELFYIGLES